MLFFKIIKYHISIRFRNVTRYSMGCKLAKPEIGYFLGSILVSNQYGLSVTDRRTVHVAPDETIYNFQTYAGKLSRF